jgi:GT2 family glycosyltransferase
MPTILNKALDSEFLKARWPMSTLWGMAPLYESGAAARQVEAISGACLMVTRHAFEAVGRFTEEYFMYAEDIDLCHKLRAVGLSNYFVPAATVIHHGGGSSSKDSGSVFSAVMMPEANLRFLRRTRGQGYALGYRGVMAGAALVRLPILGVAQTLYALRMSRAPRSGSLRKWVAILRWSLRNHELVRQHYPAERQR